jgi:transposase
VILALDAGYTLKEVAEILLLDEETVRNIRKKYEKRQFYSDWLANSYKGYEGKLTKEQEAEIDQYVRTETITDCRRIVNFIKQRYNKNFTITGVTKLLHRLGFVYKQVVLIPGKLNEEKQKVFVENYEELKQKKPNDEVILFGDGVHPTHNIHKTKAWVKKGEDKQIKTNTGRGRLNINGVLDTESLEVTVHYSETINAKEVIIFFNKLQEKYKGKKIKIIVDNARYYKNKAVQAYLARKDCRIELIFLPAYSPNLNFIERLWKFLKKYIIGVKYREKFREFEYDIRQFFDHIDQYETQLRQFIGTELHLVKVTI